MAESSVVLSVGVVSAVGLTAGEMAASVRSATMRFTESEIRDRSLEPVTVAEVPEDGLSELIGPLGAMNLTSRQRRMLQIAAAPLRECLLSLPANTPAPGLVLALPETETARPLDRPGFLELLVQQSGLAFDARASDGSHSGRAGGLLALRRAAELVQSRTHGFMVAGGVDSYLDLYVLDGLDAEGRLKSSANLDGFIPGEGAAFLLIASREAAAAAGLKAIASISAVADEFETGHLRSEEPYLGEGLARAVTKLIQTNAVKQPFCEVFSSMNGESYWAKEWGVTLVRNHNAFAEDHRIHHPADCCGDTGAASGPLMCALAAMGIRDGYYRSPCLVYASSDGGQRAALAVDTA
ncbi:MAG: beta-ketoacyl synthase N-terminal-like domain-containing protein [Gemmatimonadales bacterium]|jgi:3-oxoacyl-[acyl-carrier-protein] synthase-1